MNLIATDLTLPITHANVQEWFPAPHVENPMAGDPWWQLQCLGLFMATQILRLVPEGDYQQQALIELRRGIDTGLLTLKAPLDSEVRRRMAQTLAPWCPSAFDVVEKMLDLAQLKPGEWLLDLGSGDGRIVFAAARRGARAVGIEIDQRFVAEARERIGEHVAYQDAVFFCGDIKTLEWGEPDVVTCYLLTSSMEALKQKFRALRPGTRIISHAFGMTGWKPTRQIETPSGPLMLWVV